MGKETPTSDVGDVDRATEQEGSSRDDGAQVARQCINCARSLDAGDFCPHCGQRQRQERLTFRNLARQAAADAFSLNRGFLHTLVDLTRRPGGVPRDFLDGRTVPYTSPTRYFLICLAVAQLVAFWSEGIQGLAEGLAGPNSPFVNANDGHQLIRKFFVLMSAGALPGVILATRIFFVGARLNWVEHTVFHLYAAGHSALLFSACVAGVMVLPESVGCVVISGLFIAVWLHYLRAAHAFFNVSKVRAAFSVTLAIVSGVALFVILLGTLVSA